MQDDAAARRLAEIMAARSFVGIDFGASTTVASVAQFDRASRRMSYEPLQIRQMLATGQGCEDHLVPSCIALHRGAVLFGKGAAELKPELRAGATVFSSFKMELGVDLGPSYAASKLDGSDGKPKVEKPQDAARCFLEWLRHGIEKAVADKGLPAEICYTVSVPASFEANQRQDLAAVLEGAGYPADRLTLVDEPNAAFLGHVAELSDRGEAPLAALGAGDKRVMVFDFGAGTCDVSVLQASQEGAGLATRNLSISRFMALGGDDIDRAVARDLLLGGLRAEDGRPFELTQTQVEEDVLRRLSPAAERLKVQANRLIARRDVTDLERARALNEEIADEAIVPIKLKVRNGPNDPSTRDAVLRLDRPSLSLGGFAAAMGPFLERPEDGDDARPSIHVPVDDALRKAGLEDGELDAILFIGGSAESPLVRRALTDRFGRFVEPLVPRDLRSHVSQGSAVHALHRHGLGTELITPILADAISVITLDGSLQPIVPAGTPAPSDRIEVDALYIERDGQMALELPFCSGAEDKLVGVLHIRAPERTGFRAGERINVACSLTADKLLNIEVTAGSARRSAEFMNPLSNRPLSAAEQSVLRARQHFNQSAAANRGRPSASAVENYAEAAAAAGDWRVAAEMFEALERLSPGDDHATKITYFWSRAGREALAAAWARTAYERNPGATTAFNLALDMSRAGDVSACERLSREALEQDPGHLATLDWFGRRLFERGDPEGRGMLERCVAICRRLIGAGQADLDDAGRMLQAARALGDEEAVQLARRTVRALQPPLARPYDESNLAAGTGETKRGG
ncbi:Hsp70 family protein [Rhodovulum sp. DZ06]|uniref:Hsp70 family protein n=1 Tax=Rhodovulum sp. DZ06 TaxID=3425126 RepID=UPI003D32B928